MIQLVLGLKGSGKTKYLLDNIQEAVDSSKGCVVAIERGENLRFDIGSLDTYKEACEKYGVKK